MEWNCIRVCSFYLPINIWKVCSHEIFNHLCDSRPVKNVSRHSATRCRFTHHQSPMMDQSIDESFVPLMQFHNSTVLLPPWEIFLIECCLQLQRVYPSQCPLDLSWTLQRIIVTSSNKLQIFSLQNKITRCFKAMQKVWSRTAEYIHSCYQTRVTANDWAIRVIRHGCSIWWCRWIWF